VGAAITFPTAQWVANGLVSGATGGGGGGFPGGGGGGIQIGAAAGSTINRVSVAVTPAVFLYAVALAVVLALLASVVPAWRVSTVRPAEVLRNGYE
jgi:ABC-type lipoprotein release transport system permease subunit